MGWYANLIGLTVTGSNVHKGNELPRILGVHHLCVNFLLLPKYAVTYGANVQILLYTDWIFFFSIISQVSMQLLVNVMKFVLISTLGTQCVFELVMDKDGF